MRRAIDGLLTALMLATISACALEPGEEEPGEEGLEQLGGASSAARVPTAAVTGDGLPDGQQPALAASLVNAASKCVTRGPVLGDHVTVCSRVQREPGVGARAYGAMDATNGAVDLDLRAVYLGSSNWFDLEHTPRKTGRGYINAATKVWGPFGCGDTVYSDVVYTITWRDGSQSGGMVTAEYLTCSQ